MTEPVLATIAQWLLFAGVSIMVGCVAWRVVVAPGALRLLSEGRIGVPQTATTTLGDIERRVARGGMVTGFVLLAVWALRMVVQVIGFRDPFVPLWDDVSFLLFETFWGTVWMAQGVVLPLLTLAFGLAARRSGDTSDSAPTAIHRQDASGPAATMQPAAVRPRAWKMAAPWRFALVLTLLLVTSLALSSHAMGVESWRPFIVVADGVHALAAGVWIGALALILTAGRPRSGASAGATDFDVFAAQIRSFSPLAMVSVAGLLTMGIVLSWTHLVRVSDLWTVNYGRILAAKITLTLAVLLAGLVNWRRGIPALSSDGGARAIWRRGMLEVYLALGVLLLTAMLVHSVKPE